VVQICTEQVSGVKAVVIAFIFFFLSDEVRIFFFSFVIFFDK
jgi:hypothetical protein